MNNSVYSPLLRIRVGVQSKFKHVFLGKNVVVCKNVHDTFGTQTPRFHWINITCWFVRFSKGMVTAWNRTNHSVHLSTNRSPTHMKKQQIRLTILKLANDVFREDPRSPQTSFSPILYIINTYNDNFNPWLWFLRVAENITR